MRFSPGFTERTNTSTSRQNEFHGLVEYLPGRCWRTAFHVVNDVKVAVGPVIGSGTAIVPREDELSRTLCITKDRR